MLHPLPILGFAAPSGTGKTTLLEQLIPLLVAQGIRIALIKHAHHHISMDTPGKDSYRLREAGAATVVLATATARISLHTRPEVTEPQLTDEIATIDPGLHDLILVEGFKTAQFPKIELHRASLGHAPAYLHDPAIIAIASDAPGTLTDLGGRSVLDINRPEAVAAFIIRHFRASLPQRPTSSP